MKSIHRCQPGSVGFLEASDGASITVTRAATEHGRFPGAPCRRTEFRRSKVVGRNFVFLAGRRSTADMVKNIATGPASAEGITINTCHHIL